MITVRVAGYYLVCNLDLSLVALMFVRDLLLKCFVFWFSVVIICLKWVYGFCIYFGYCDD